VTVTTAYNVFGVARPRVNPLPAGGPQPWYFQGTATGDGSGGIVRLQFFLNYDARSVERYVWITDATAVVESNTTNMTVALYIPNADWWEAPVFARAATGLPATGVSAQNIATLVVPSAPLVCGPMVARGTGLIEIFWPTNTAGLLYTGTVRGFIADQAVISSRDLLS